MKILDLLQTPTKYTTTFTLSCLKHPPIPTQGLNLHTSNLLQKNTQNRKNQSDKLQSFSDNSNRFPTNLRIMVWLEFHKLEIRAWSFAHAMVALCSTWNCIALLKQKVHLGLEKKNHLQESSHVDSHDFVGGYHCHRHCLSVDVSAEALSPYFPS